MSTLLDLRNTTRLFFGAVEVGELWLDGSKVWSFDDGTPVVDEPTTAFAMAGAPTQSSLRVSTFSTANSVLDVTYSTAPDLSSPTVVQLSTDAVGAGAVTLSDLPAATRVYYTVGGSEIQSARTAGGLTDPLRFAFGSCAKQLVDVPTFQWAADRGVDFFFSLGDTPYSNYGEPEVEPLRSELVAYYESPLLKPVTTTMPWVYIWDDHDFGPNNSDSTNPAASAVQQVYRELQPHYTLEQSTGPVYFAFTNGPARFIVMDLRSERTADNMMSAAQMQWVKDELSAAAANADTPLVILINTVPWITGSGDIDDTWVTYPAERVEIGDHIMAENLQNRLVMLSGDAHMLAHDDGTNNTFNSTGTPSFQVFHSAPLGNGNSVKGGPYTTAPVTSSEYQYSIMDAELNADGEVDVVVTAYSDDVEVFQVAFTTDDPTAEVTPPPVTKEADSIYAGSVGGSASAGTHSAVISLLEPICTEGRVAVVFSGAGNSYNSGPDATGLTITPLDASGAAIGSPVPMTRAGTKQSNYAGAAAWATENVNWPAGAARARLSCSLNAPSSSSFTYAWGIYDLVGLSGLNAHFVGHASGPLQNGPHDFPCVSPIGEALFVGSLTSTKSGADDTWLSDGDVQEDYTVVQSTGSSGRAASTTARASASYLRVGAAALFISPT